MIINLLLNYLTWCITIKVRYLLVIAPPPQFKINHPTAGLNVLYTIFFIYRLQNFQIKVYDNKTFFTIDR